MTIYLPDGTKEQFIMGFTGVTYNFAGPPLATTSIFFVPVPGTGTTGTLEGIRTTITNTGLPQCIQAEFKTTPQYAIRTFFGI